MKTEDEENNGKNKLRSQKMQKTKSYDSEKRKNPRRNLKSVAKKKLEKKMLRKKNLKTPKKKKKEQTTT